MNAEIIAIGTELLLGQINNTNAKFLSEQLAEIGVNVYFQTVVGDNPDRLEKAIQIAEERSNLILFTGGLGPTKDDLTKETIGKHLGRGLVTDQKAMQTIYDFFQRTGRKMTENNKKQALVIDGATVLPNERGMAPGMFLKDQTHYYILLPGPPHEMEPMFIKYARPAILEQLEDKMKIESRVLRYFGIGESQLVVDIEEILDSQTNPTVAPLASDGEVSIRITARHTNEAEAIKMIDKMEQRINEHVGEYFYGYDDTSLMNELLILLNDKNLTIAAAESLTGGLFQSEMISASGVSSVLKGGIVCYSNEAKISLCQVKKDTIEKFGAVSEECALELAENVRKLLNTNIGISFTGVAGPDSLEGHLPGTVWIGIAIEGKQPKAMLLNLGGSRNSNRRRAVKYGCYYLINELDQSI